MVDEWRKDSRYKGSDSRRREEVEELKSKVKR